MLRVWLRATSKCLWWRRPCWPWIDRFVLSRVVEPRQICKQTANLKKKNELTSWNGMAFILWHRFCSTTQLTWDALSNPLDVTPGEEDYWVLNRAWFQFSHQSLQFHSIRFHLLKNPHPQMLLFFLVFHFFSVNAGIANLFLSQLLRPCRGSVIRSRGRFYVLNFSFSNPLSLVIPSYCKMCFVFVSSGARVYLNTMPFQSAQNVFLFDLSLFTFPSPVSMF